MITKCKLPNGFTLLELMIVVVIIGILASVAIPGFSRYIRDSKKNESMGIMKSVADGSVIYFNQQHVYDDKGFRIFQNIFPGCDESGAATPTPCDMTPSYTGTPIVSQRISPLDPELKLKEIPWTRLNIRISRPFYYILFYTSDVTAGSSSFSVTARASLDAPNDSEFVLSGTSKEGSPSINNIIETVDGVNE